MAKKDWQKININEWINKSKNVSLLVGKKGILGPKSTDFYVKIKSLDTASVTTNYFYTKLKTLKFAKSYMSKN